MKTLIIITLLLLVLTIVLIVLIAKKFQDKTDYILASNTIVSSNITDNAKKILDLLDTIKRTQQDNFNKIIFKIEKGVKANGDAYITIIDLINVANRALVNSINAIEEKLSTVPNSEDIIDSDELVNRIAEGSENIKIGFQEIKTRLCTLNNLDSKLNAIISKICSETESIQIPDELLDMIAEYIGNKIIEIQAKNSLSTTKTKKPSSAKSKHRTRAKKANNSYNSVQDAPQEKVNEEQLN